MYDFGFDPAQPREALYRDLAQAAGHLVAQEADAVANMANLAALLWQAVPRLNWAGFYRAIDGELVLGPFIGKPACIRIPFGQGVCGAAAMTLRTQCVPDVHAFPGHIACDAASRAELVVPVIEGGRLLAVIDLDSPEPARFDAVDVAGIEAFAAIAGPAIRPAS